MNGGRKPLDSAFEAPDLVHYFVPAQKPEDPRPPDPRRGVLIGFAVIALLVLAGLYLVRVLGNASRIQDCVMQGRSNCAPLDTP